MQIRKCLLAVCFALAALSVQAALPDSAAQVKAREALQEKLKAIDAAATTNAPAVTNATAPAEPVPPAAAAPAAAAATAPAAATPFQTAPTTANGVPIPADPAVIEKARESMHKKMEEVTAAEVAADAAAKQAAAQPPPNKPEIAKNPPENPPSKPPKQPTSLGLEPIEPPPLPISAEKKQQLDALLTRYKADQITPDQYQAERAKILQGN